MKYRVLLVRCSQTLKEFQLVLLRKTLWAQKMSVKVGDRIHLGIDVLFVGKCGKMEAVETSGDAETTSSSSKSASLTPSCAKEATRKHRSKHSRVRSIMQLAKGRGDTQDVTNKLSR